MAMSCYTEVAYPRPLPSQPQAYNVLAFSSPPNP